MQLGSLNTDVIMLVLMTSLDCPSLVSLPLYQLHLDTPPSFCYVYPNYHHSHPPSSPSYLPFKVKFKFHLPTVFPDSVVATKEYFLISCVHSTLSHMIFSSLDAHTTMDKYRGAQTKIIIFLPHIQIKEMNINSKHIHKEVNKHHS